jgi:2-(1,2-epoxy-1,2-dihydrophenyl)acetyl-CoA isomerase
LVFATAAARFTPAYAGVGLSPDCGLTWILPRLVGLRRSQHIILTNRTLDASEAERIGMITRAVPDGDLPTEVAAAADSLVHGATGAAGRARVLLRDSYDTSLERHLEAEARAIAEAAHSVEAKEGVAAFLAKRPPKFFAG